MYGQPIFPDVSTSSGPLTMEKIQTTRRWGDLLQETKEEEAYLVPQPEEEEEEEQQQQQEEGMEQVATIPIEVEAAKLTSAMPSKQPQKPAQVLPLYAEKLQEVKVEAQQDAMFPSSVQYIVPNAEANAAAKEEEEQKKEAEKKKKKFKF